MAADRTSESFLDWYGVWPGAVGYEPDGRAWLGDAPSGVKLSVQPAEKSEPFLRPDQPWERGGLNQLNVRREDWQYRMWYTAYAPEHGRALLYATSDDGFHWTRPNLGLHEYAGSRQNNILHTGRAGDNVFLDPDAPPSERYKMLDTAGSFLHEGKEVGGSEGMQLLNDGQEVAIDGWVIGLVSPDGIRWTQLEGRLLHLYSDGQNIAYFDATKKTYVGYFRVNMFRDVGPATWPPNPRRCVGRSETADFRHWPAPRIVLQPDSQDPSTDDFYGNAFCWHPGGAHQLMFPAVYHRAHDTLDAQLAVSRDGVNWTRPERAPIITLDPGEHALYCSPEMVPLGRDRWGLPYFVFRQRHNESYYYQSTEPDGAFRWATWRRDRLVALEAATEGQVTLLPLTFTGGPVVLNYRTGANGWIRVEVIGPNPLWPATRAEPVPGYAFDQCEPLRGDELDGVVRWDGGAALAPMAGRNLCLRIRLSHAKLFSVRV